MRDKVLAAIEVYAAGGTIERALESVGISRGPFRRLVRTDPDVLAAYESAMRSRSYVFLDEAYTVSDQMGTENGLAPMDARVKSEILLKLSGANNPERFGAKLAIQHEVKPNLIAAIDEGKRRAALPQRDLALITDAQYTVIEPQIATVTSDKQSAAPGIADAPTAIDPFEA